MKDEMIKHALPPTVLVKLATITGKVFRRYDIRLDDIKFGCNDFKDQFVTRALQFENLTIEKGEIL